MNLKQLIRQKKLKIGDIISDHNPSSITYRKKFIYLYERNDEFFGYNIEDLRTTGLSTRYTYWEIDIKL